MPEYVGGIVEFLNGSYNGANAKPITVSDAARRPSTRPSRCSTRPGITLLNPSPATDTNAFFVTKKYADAEQRHHAVRPQGQVGRAGRGARLQGPPRLRGRPVVDVRHQHHQDPAARLRQPADLRLGARRASPSSARPARPTARSRARAWCCSPTTSTSSRRRTSCRRSRRRSSHAHPDVAGSAEPADGRAHHREARPSSTPRCRSTGQKPEDVAQQWLSDAGSDLTRLIRPAATGDRG